jgi:RNA polymerase sigma factor (sigma-70 family)
MRIDVSDAELVTALSAGKPEAFRTAWDRFSPLVGRVLRHALGSDELDDVKQEVFTCLFRRVATLRDPHSLRAFVLAITLNTVKYERRKRRKRARIALTPDAAELNVVGRDQPGSHLAFARFLELLRKLKRRERATFVLRFVEGMTVGQVALEMKLSEPTVRRSFSRAWARVQRWAARDPFLSDYLFLRGERRRPRPTVAHVHSRVVDVPRLPSRMHAEEYCSKIADPPQQRLEKAAPARFQRRFSEFSATAG